MKRHKRCSKIIILHSVGKRAKLSGPPCTTTCLSVVSCDICNVSDSPLAVLILQISKHTQHNFSLNKNTLGQWAVNCARPLRRMQHNTGNYCVALSANMGTSNCMYVSKIIHVDRNNLVNVKITFSLSQHTKAIFTKVWNKWKHKE